MPPLRLLFLSAGLGALGLTALIVVAMGTYRPEKTTLIQEVRTLNHKMPAGYDDKTFRCSDTRYAEFLVEGLFCVTLSPFCMPG